MKSLQNHIQESLEQQKIINEGVSDYYCTYYDEKKYKLISEKIDSSKFSKFDFDETIENFEKHNENGYLLLNLPMKSMYDNFTAGLLSKHVMANSDEYFRIKEREIKGYMYMVNKAGKKPEILYAIIQTSMSGVSHYGFVVNDKDLGNGRILDKATFKKTAERIADQFGNKFWVNNPGGFVKKIYSNKDLFIKDYEKLEGNKPKLD